MATALTLNEIRARALAFAKEWKGETSESAEKQSFWNDFFNVFGIHRRRYAAFEVPVSLRDGKHGKIDLFWPGLVLVEHKSGGQDLTAAFKQATNYFEGIEDEDLPKFVIVSDFARFRVYNTDGGEAVQFALDKLHTNIAAFGFLTGHQFRHYEESPEVNVKAARYMGDLHEALLKNGYSGQQLAVLLVRLMFCFFADKTGIFQTNLFRDIIELKTHEDGHDVGPLLVQVFSVLDKPRDKRELNLDADLKELEYVNGHLFEERIDPPSFDARARKLLLRCAGFDWSAVSPAIFGAMFQSVMDEEAGKRRKIGAHYTSEKNILKCLRPLLIDGLRAEFDKAGTEAALRKLLARIGNMTVLDPACGCGNFLIIAYRELRQLEIDIHWRLLELSKRTGEKYLSVAFTQGLNVDSMYGIEIEEFPCRVAETALYLIDHLMNNRASERFGENFRRLPLTKSPRITNGNALRLDWSAVVPSAQLTCIVGNPPFIGKSLRNQAQAEDMDIVFGEWGKHSELDYVAAWYVKAADFVSGTTTPVAFVSTNSITQGEQVSILWPRLVQRGVRIRFAHRTFRWDNDAPGEAAVHCVIIGWAFDEPRACLLFDYETVKADPMVRSVKRINAYLIDAEDLFVYPRRTPLCDVPPIAFGNMPNDGGHLLLTREDRDALLQGEPGAARFIRRIYGSKEFINGIDRWCLWLKDATPAELRDLPMVMDRVRKVRETREKSKRETTRALAKTPTLFGEIRQPAANFLAIPKTSSEFRAYIPMGFLTPSDITTTEIQMVANADLYHFGVLSSVMHMAWVRQVCGRLKSDFRYSNEIVYNNYPWPSAATEKQRQAVRDAARALLDARAFQAGQSLADLYDVDVMPGRLLKAHRELDRVVDACYGALASGKSKPTFDTELSRVRYLFERYADLIAAGQMPLKLSAASKGRRANKSD